MLFVQPVSYQVVNMTKISLYRLDQQVFDDIVAHATICNQPLDYCPSHCEYMKDHTS